MKDTQQISLEDRVTERFDIPAGSYVFVTMTTQADYAYEVKISDDNGQVYFDQRRQSNVPTPPATAVFRTTAAGANIEIKVTNPPSGSVNLRYSTLDVTDPSNEKIASTITYVGEDGCDTDWNDVYLSVAWWKNAG
jgi:hypothetical protein